MKNKTEYPKKQVTLNGMTAYELCRWAALKDAIDIIGEKCDEKKLNFDTFDLEPLKIQKYVDSATDVLYHKVTTNEQVF
jgi:type VI protein secretion system component Hcp